MEVKFRAYGVLETEEEYRMHSCVNIDHLGMPYVGKDAVLDHNLMQFTGLKDKNGEDIYDGDIVKVFDNSLFFGKVKYDPEFARFSMKVFERELPTSSWKNYEVVGNIYDA